MKKGFVGAIAVTALLALYMWAVVGSAFALIGTGKGIGIAIGLGALTLPLLCLVLIAREFQLARTVSTMAGTLLEAGELPIDTFPRSRGGRIDRAAADAAFTPARVRVEENPRDWRAWYNLAFAYDASGDRRRARAALRSAAKLFREPAAHAAS